MACNGFCFRGKRMCKVLTVLLAVWLCGCQSAGAADCRRVADEPFIRINSEALRTFQRYQLTRVKIFDLLKSVAQVETSGCWAGISDNFDKQLISAGVLQWNYGQNSVQVLLRNFKRSMGAQFQPFLNAHMPLFGSAVFSDRCLRDKAEGQPHPCQTDFLDPADPQQKKLRAGLAAEFKVLFERDEMIQLQMDRVMATMEKTLDFSRRLFGDEFVSEKSFHWMLDIIVQQGGFDNLEAFKNDAARAWAYARSAGSEHQRMTATGILVWYAGHALSPDQGGLDCDWRYNIEKWSKLVASGSLDDEKFKLLLMSWMRARTASGENGRWQALAFQRRAKIGLGLGSVAGSSVHRDNHYGCVMPKPEDMAAILKVVSQ
jgi:hypothetical protein